MEIQSLKYNPELLIPEKVYNKLLTNVRATKLEMTFILEIKRLEEVSWAFLAEDVHIPPQWNEPAESKTIDSQYPQWCYQKITEEKVTLNGHGHTHPNMSTNPSGYDTTFFEQLKTDTNTFQFRLITNHKGHIRCDLIDKEQGFICTNVPVIVPCKGFNLHISSSTYNIEITNPAELEVIDIFPDFTALFGSHYITVSKNTIDNALIDGDLILKETRKSQTDEGCKHKLTPHYKALYDEYNPYYGNYYQTNMYEYMQEEEEAFPTEYDLTELPYGNKK